LFEHDLPGSRDGFKVGLRDPSIPMLFEYGLGRGLGL
jgi:hypothetical protein